MQCLRFPSLKLCVLLLIAATPAWGDKADPIDYAKLDLSIHLSRLRAGNHDESGENDYYFRTTVIGLPVLKEEIKKSFADRLKIEKVQGDFGEIKLETLKYWLPEKKPGSGLSIAISGDTFRKIVAETMRSFNVAEDQVAVLCKTEMFERQKKLVFFGSDLKVGEADYFLIPETLPHAPQSENTELQIADALGTLVKLSLQFKENENSKSAGSSSSTASSRAAPARTP